VSPEEAWALTRFARTIRISAEWLLEKADAIDDNADQVWDNRSNHGPDDLDV
jgi:hypothetical protein